MRWLTNIIATPWVLRPDTTPNSRSTSRCESAAVGSSMIRTRASTDSARAISTSCCSDVLSSFKQTFRAAGEADDVEQLGSPPAHALPSTPPSRVSRHVAEIDVLVNAEVAEEARMLMHHRDTGAGGFKRRPVFRRAPVDQNGSGVRLIHSREQLDAGALARAILTKEREHFSRNEIEGHVANCDHAAEPLRGRREPGRRLAPRCDGSPLDKVADIAARLSADWPRWKTGSRSGHLSRTRQWRLRLLTLRFRSQSTSGASAGATQA